ncbi:MAG: hypothetical protein ACI9B9_000278 [Halioglobus sp.]|jgi:hypothetical protein
MIIMPIHNTTLVAPTAKIAPLLNNPVSTESTTIGAVFGEILSEQNQLLPHGEAIVTAETGLVEGGNLLQSGGKNLPELLAAVTPAPAPAVTLDPATVAIEGTLTVSAITPHASGEDLLERLPVVEQLPAEMVGQLSPLPAPLINPEVYQLSKQGATAPLVEEYRLPIQIIGEGVASGQNPRAEVRPLGGATVVAPLELDQAMPAVIRNVGVGPDQPVTKSFLDAGIQSRQAQLLGSGVESNTAISESKIGLDLSQAKMPAANFATNLATTAAPISGAMALPVGQTDGAAALKMTAVSTMTMAPGEPSWNNEFAARVSVVVKNGLQEASLQLNPPELGRLDVKISTDGDQTKIVFNVQNGAAKDAIELAMPRLREMLEQSGLQLAHSDVSDQSAFQRHDSEEAGNVVSNFAQDTIAENSETSLFTRAVVSPDALVDYYI